MHLKNVRITNGWSDRPGVAPYFGGCCIEVRSGGRLRLDDSVVERCECAIPHDDERTPPLCPDVASKAPATGRAACVAVRYGGAILAVDSTVELVGTTVSDSFLNNTRGGSAIGGAGADKTYGGCIAVTGASTVTLRGSSVERCTAGHNPTSVWTLLDGSTVQDLKLGTGGGVAVVGGRANTRDAQIPVHSVHVAPH